MPACVCHEYLQHPFATVDDALIGTKYDAVIANAEQLARSETKWMLLYRCRLCEPSGQRAVMIAARSISITSSPCRRPVTLFGG